jgi:hypothetical protein
MDSGRIVDALQFFRDAGGLHDSEIQRVEWDLVEHRIALRLDDLRANFRGDPDYKRTPGILMFEDVNAFSTDIAPADCHRYIYDIEIDQRANELQVRVLCAPGGIIEILCDSVTVLIEPWGEAAAER